MSHQNKNARRKAARIANHKKPSAGSIRAKLAELNEAIQQVITGRLAHNKDHPDDPRPVPTLLTLAEYRRQVNAKRITT